MNEQQTKDSDECVQMEENGQNKDCFGCSCNVCLLQTDYISRKEVFNLIDKELELTKNANPETAMGMMQIRKLIAKKL